MIELNASQFKKHKNADDRALIHNSTGSVNLSPAYARKHRKTKPDMYVNGALIESMEIAFFAPNEYLIDASIYFSKYLEINYDDLYGIAPSNRSKAFSITTPMIAALYKRLVL